MDLILILFQSNLMGFIIVFLVTSILLMFVAVGMKKTFNSSFFQLSIGISLCVVVVTWVLPIPQGLQNTLKMYLYQFQENEFESNGMLNIILIRCMDNGGYLRGIDYKNVMETYDRDISNHLEKNHSFTLSIKHNYKTDESICDFAIKYNDARNKR